MDDAYVVEVGSEGEVEVALPDPLGHVSFTVTGDRLEANASSLPDHDRIFVSRQSEAVGEGSTLMGSSSAGAFAKRPGQQPSFSISAMFVVSSPVGGSTRGHSVLSARRIVAARPIA